MRSTTTPAVSNRHIPFSVSSSIHAAEARPAYAEKFLDPEAGMVMVRRLMELERTNPKAFALAEAYITRHHRGTMAAINGSWKEVN